MIRFLKQLWPWTRERQFFITFRAEWIDPDRGTQWRDGDMVLKTTGRVDAITLRAIATLEVNKVLKEEQRDHVTFWISRVA